MWFLVIMLSNMMAETNSIKNRDRKVQRVDSNRHRLIPVTLEIHSPYPTSYLRLMALPIIEIMV